MALPRDVVADSNLRVWLSAAASASSGALALISGRTIADLDQIFEPLRLPAAGQHGGEMRFPDGSEKHPPTSLMDAARPRMREFVESHSGLWLEDKGGTLAVHYRDRPDLALTVFTFVSGFGPGDDVAVQQGKFVIELKPARFNKGTAIAAFMAQPPFQGRSPVFYGDDLTDEAGFAYVNSVGGRSIHVGDDDVPTQARERRRDPAAVRAELAALVGGG